MKHSIAYAGRVHIKVKGKPPVRKNNNGTNVFFNLMRNIMTLAEIERSKSLPYYMSIVLPNNNEEDFNNKPQYSEYEPLVLHPILITSRTVPYHTDSGETKLQDGTCVLSALLPHSSTSMDEISQLSSAYIVLLNNADPKQILAYTKADQTALRPVFEDENGQAVIEWELTFGNQTGGSK